MDSSPRHGGDADGAFEGPPRRALVLSGGGARGAYEAGVLRWILEAVPRELGGPPAIEILSGTSVGAIHACYLAATANEGVERARRLAALWRGLRIREVVHLSGRELLRLPGRALRLVRGSRDLQAGRLPPRLYGLMDTAPLERVVLNGIPWRGIRRNLREGRVRAVCLAATQVATGRVVCFTEHRGGSELPWTHDQTIVARPSRIGPHHALASAAIPGLFPTVRVGSTYYADGGMRLNTPLAPALRLGADRVLVVALRHGATTGEEAAVEEQRVEQYGNPVFLLGKVLNALLLDHVDTDLDRMRLLNDILRSGGEAFGEAFLERTNEVVEKRRGQRFRVVEDLVIRPSEDLGRVAAEVFERQRRTGKLPPWLRVLLRGLGAREPMLEADLLSYLYFDEEYTAALIDLGYHDAGVAGDRLLRFFGP